MTSDAPVTVITGSITADADREDVAAIRQAIRDRGFAVDIDFSDGSITVERGPDVEPGGEVQLSEEYQGMSSEEIIAAVRDEHSLDGDRDDDPEPEQPRQELAEKARAAKRGDGQYEPLDADDSTDQEPVDDSERSDTENEPQQDDTGADAEQAAEDSSDPDEQHLEEADAEPEPEEDGEDEDEEPTKRERRIQRLKDGIEDGEPYTSDELAAIAYDKDAADVTPSEKAYVANLRTQGGIQVDSMDDPNRNGNAKLYYRGEQPDIEEQASEEDAEGNESGSPEQSSSGDDVDADDVAEDGCDCPTDESGELVHVESCPESVEQDNAAMEDMYDAETEDRINEMLQTGRFTHAEIADELDVAIDRVEEIHHEQHTEDVDEGADDEELLDDIGPCNIGKIMVQGTFQRYECNECSASFTDEGRADDHPDEENHPTFKAYNQRPEKAKQPAGFVGGGTAR